MRGCGDTIFALSSGAGRAGVAVVRISGPDAAQTLVALAGPLPRARHATLRRVRDPFDGESIDRGLVLWFPSPGSFTGEDVAELHIHGGRAVLDALWRAFGRMPGVRLAEPGEFTRRAFQNGKIDLTAAEGIGDLIDAQTEAQRRQALRVADGQLQMTYDTWRSRLIEAMALVEAELDFADEGDVPADHAAMAGAILEGLSHDIRAHLADGRRGEILRDGLHVMLAGAPNVGKSSLLNALARRDVAIVSPEAGTTRDVIEVRLDLDGLPVVVCDTAGIRDAPPGVEAEGIRRTMGRAETADLIVWISDATARPDPLPEALRKRAADIIHVSNKTDLPAAASAGRDAIPSERVGGPINRGSRSTRSDESLADRAESHDRDDLREPIRLSARTGLGIADLVSAMTAAARARLVDNPSPVPTRARHRLHLEAARLHIEAARRGTIAELELRAEELRLASVALGRITGRVDVEDVLDRIFASFCIGK